MSRISDAAVDLETALKLIPEVSVHRDPGAPLTSPPAVVIGPPALEWESGCPAPTAARFLVYVVVTADERAVERLWELVELVAATIDTQTDAAVIRADPAVFVSGTSQLPCYEIQTEVPL